jgi:hypothetical protein
MRYIWACVYLCSLIARGRINQFTPNLACLLCLRTRKIFQECQYSESVISSRPVEGGFCSLETRHDRGTAPKPKFFKRRDNRTETISPKICPGFVSRDDSFCSSVNGHGRRPEPRT